MKRTLIHHSLFPCLLILCLILTSCSNSGESPNGGSPNLAEADCNYTITQIDEYVFVEPEPCNIVFDLSDGTRRSREFYPVAGNNPSPVSEKYFFVIRQGNPRKLLINFMGGGACWSGSTCLDNVTNYVYADIEAFAPGTVTADTMILFELAFGGIIDNTNDDNPFKDYTLVFLPYTTGDIHWGSSDQTYTDAQGNQVTVNHHGFDNFLAALRYVRDAYPPEEVNDVFVVGQSAGSYGAIFNFPYIRETYPFSNAHVLGDGGAGVVTSSFNEDTIQNWGVLDNIPDWIPGIDEYTYTNLTMGAIFKRVGAYYPESNVGQYTTMYDHNQRYFYYVMQETDNPDVWSDLDGNGFGVPDSVTCDWNVKMLDQIDIAMDASNYQAYIAPGEIHTITTSNDLYTTFSNEVGLIDWIQQMLGNDPAWTTIMCVDCKAPATKESPEGVVCP